MSRSPCVLPLCWRYPPGAGAQLALTQRLAPYHGNIDPVPLPALALELDAMPSALREMPKKQFFRRTQRAFSSGCIRLSQPQKLASWLLGRSDWDSAEIEELFASNSSRMIQLDPPVELTIGYWTAWVDDVGRLNFRDDIYGRDQQLARELRQRRGRDARL